MISPYDIAKHWPYVRSHLLLRSPKKRESTRELVGRLLAEGQVRSGGDPVPLSRSRLAELEKATQGQGGNVWRELQYLRRDGVVFAYPSPGGRRAALWSFTPALSEWRMPWRFSSREPEMVIGSCSCRAVLGFAARNPGQSAVFRAKEPIFDLPPEAHLGFWTEFRAAKPDDRAANPSPPGLMGSESRGRGAPSPFLSVEGINPPSSGEEEANLSTLRKAIARKTGKMVWGEPEARLRAVARGCDGVLEELLAEFEHERPAGAPLAVTILERLLPVVREQVHDNAQARRTADERRLRFLESIPRDEWSEEWVAEALAIEQRLSRL